MTTSAYAITTQTLRDGKEPEDSVNDTQAILRDTIPANGGDFLFYRDVKNQRICIGCSTTPRTPRGILDIQQDGIYIGISTQTAIQTSNGFTHFTGNTFIEVYHSTAQVIPSGVETKINFDTEIADSRSEFASGSFTAKATGGYNINAAVLFNTSGADYRNLLQISVNGTNIGQEGSTCSVNVDCGISVHKSIYLTAGDVLIININQNSGSGKTIHVGRANTWLSIAKIN